ncbi:interleukin-17 receptor C [Eudromia elegans]
MGAPGLALLALLALGPGGRCTPRDALACAQCRGRCPRPCGGCGTGTPGAGAEHPTMRTVPRLQVLRGPHAALVRLQEAALGHNYTLRLYHNRSRGAGSSGRTVPLSADLGYSVPADEVLPCLCLQVWPEVLDPPRATSCPFSQGRQRRGGLGRPRSVPCRLRGRADAAAWERLWAQSRLLLHLAGDALSCAVSSPCDLPAELQPCWRPGPAGPCQALPQPPALPAAQVSPCARRGAGPGVAPAAGAAVSPQAPQEFPALRPHPNLCVQARSGGEARLTQCLRDLPAPHTGALPGRADDVLLVQSPGSAVLCALQRGACTPLDAFTSTGSGRPGLLAPRLRQDVAAGRCARVSAGGGDCAVPPDTPSQLIPVLPPWQVWHPPNGTAGALWACPLHPCPRRALLLHAAEPPAERAACALAAALRALGVPVAAAPGGGVAAAACGTLPWLHALHARARRDGDAIVLLLSPGAAAAARRWDGDDDGDGGDGGDGGAAPCEAFAAALACAVPALAAGGGRYAVARLEAAVAAVPRVLRAAPAFALPSQADGLLRALARPPRRMEPRVAQAAARLRRALEQPQ